MIVDLESLPEIRFDDSHHRDFYVAMGLCIVRNAIRALQNPDSVRETAQLGHLVEDFANEFEVPEQVARLREEVLGIDVTDETSAATRVRALATETAGAIDAALAPVAQIYGWPVDRVRRPA